MPRGDKTQRGKRTHTRPTKRQTNRHSNRPNLRKRTNRQSQNTKPQQTNIQQHTEIQQHAKRQQQTNRRQQRTIPILITNNRPVDRNIPINNTRNVIIQWLANAKGWQNAEGEENAHSTNQPTYQPTNRSTKTKCDKSRHVWSQPRGSTVLLLTFHVAV